LLNMILPENDALILTKKRWENKAVSFIESLIVL